MSAFSKNKGNLGLSFMVVKKLAASPWKQYLAQQEVPNYIPSELILHHAKFGRPEVHSFQITSSNTCTLENCVRPPSGRSLRSRENVLPRRFFSNFSYGQIIN